MCTRVRILQKKDCSYYEMYFEINSFIVFIYLFTKYLTCVGAKQVVHAYESVTCTNQQLLAPFVPKSSVSYKDVSTISKLIDKRSPN